MKTLHIGIVGAGAIVQQMHIPVLRCLDSATISWILDADESRASKAARANGIPHAGSATDDLTSLPTADVILLAVPWGARQSYYEQIRHLPTRPAVYVEKPFARSSAQHREIVSGFADWQVAIGTHYLDAALEVLNAQTLGLESQRIIDHAGFDVDVKGALRVQTASGHDLPLVCRFSYLESLVSECVVSFEHGRLSFEIDNPDNFSLTGPNGQRLPFQTDQSFGPHGMHGMMAVFWQEFFDSIMSRSVGRANACAMALVSRAVGLLYGEET